MNIEEVKKIIIKKIKEKKTIVELIKALQDSECFAVVNTD